MELKYAVGLACLVLLGFLVYKELRRANRTNLIARLVASVVLVAAFATLFIPITYTVNHKQGTNVLHLVTAGATKQSLAVVKGNLFGLDSAVVKENKSFKVRQLPDLAYYLQTHPELKNIQLYGNGLAKEELKKLSNYSIHWDSVSTPISGIVACNWPNLLKAAAPLSVKGRYQHIGNQPVKLMLNGLGKNLDSLSIKTEGSVDFSFKTLPKQIGKAVYHLIALQGKDTLSKEPIPFEVAKKQPINVMVLASFPDFEYKFLKKWLFENEYAVALRNRISKDKYSTDFLNRKAMNLDQLSSASLKNIDVLLIDEEELNAIGAKERATIQASVANGMGLMIRLIEPKQTNALQSFNRYESLAEKPAVLQLMPAHTSLSILPFAQTLFLKVGANEQVLVADTKGKALVTNQLYGTGQVLGTTISTSYQWQLAAKAIDYANFWSALLAKAARKQATVQSIQLVPRLPVLGESVRLIVTGNDVQSPNIRFENNQLSPRQNRELPFEWDALFWPSQKGWHTLQVNQQIHSFYVYQQSDWQNLKNANRINDTKQFIQQQQQKEAIVSADQLLQKEVSKWWFLVAFLIAACFLWYEQRVLENK